MAFPQFAEAHARLLEILSQEPDWREAVESGLVESTRAAMTPPPKTVSVFSLPADQLLAINGDAVREMIAAGERDEERLLSVLGAWPQTWPPDLPVRLSFLGLNLSMDCDMQPRCIYCNQRPVESRMTLEDWQAVVGSLRGDQEAGPYLYFTGGEPLLRGEELWGAQGLVRAATEAGCASNVNTNALALSPRAALGFIAAGLARIHISLDTHRPEVQDAIHQRPGRWGQVMRGLLNLQIAKALVAADHPVIHLNCVLTRLTADDFPGFLRFLLEMKPLVEGGLHSDLDLHVIPVGGEQNAPLRLDAEGYHRFFTTTWDAAEAVWQEYQERRQVPADQRGTLHGKLPFLSPYHRAQQRGDLEQWAQCAAGGRPAHLAVTGRCYVGPTQGFLLPDGSQHWCGGHATSRPQPLGNVLEASVPENIRRQVGAMAGLPGPFCTSCPGATQAINQSVESKLRETIHGWLNPTGADGDFSVSAQPTETAAAQFEGE